MTPAAPASAEPMKNVDAITRSTSMPIIAAASRSYEVARIALPMRVGDEQRQDDHQRDRREHDQLDQLDVDAVDAKTGS